MEKVEDEKYKILPLKNQYEIMDKILEFRLKNILPELMRKAQIDMWIVAAREYNEDPVFRTLIPAIEKTASRLSCLLFFLDDNTNVECLSICRPNLNIEKAYKREWNHKNETQWECVKRIVETRNPKKIGVNSSKNFALADGITKTLYEELSKSLGSEYANRIVSAEILCVNWLETRSLLELSIYPSIYKVAEDIIEEAFSKNVIEVGKTTTNDIEWWMMQKMNDLGLKAWFTPTVDLQRKGEENPRLSDAMIHQGDILHCDIGIEYMGLCTDTQRVAYVLKEEEESVPVGIREALHHCNHFQDLVSINFVEGRTGNQVLSAALKEANRQNMKAMCYTHPIGYHGHGAGPIIGLWDNQGFIPIRGEYTLNRNTCYALELNASLKVDEWEGQEVPIFLEETVAFTKEGIKYLGNSQTEFIVI